MPAPRTDLPDPQLDQGWATFTHQMTGTAFGAVLVAILEAGRQAGLWSLVL